MKILYVLERYPELSQTFVAQEILGLQELGIEVNVVALQHGSGGIEPANALWLSELNAATRIRSAARQALTAPSATVKQLFNEQSWPPPAATKRIRGLTRLSPALSLAQSSDHIHAHFATEAADIARLLSAASGTPYSFTAHAADAYTDIDALAVNLAGAQFARGASTHVADRLRQAASDPEKVVELPIAVDTAQFAELNGNHDPGLVVSVGRLVEKKGFSDLITAFAAVADEFPEAELRIAGAGPLSDELAEQAAATGAKISFIGPISNAEVAELMATASIFALTPKTASNGDRDGRPAVIVEAMAAGLAILSTTQPGIPELVTKECGLLATPGDTTQIAGNFRQMLSMPQGQLSALGSNGRELVIEAYGPIKVASELLALFSIEP